MLSLGEQQRLGLARALLHAPHYLFLDEATASLDEPSEAALYRLLGEKLPQTTIVSIGHRSTLEAFHQRNVVHGPRRRPDHAAGRGSANARNVPRRCRRLAGTASGEHGALHDPVIGSPQSKRAADCSAALLVFEEETYFRLVIAVRSAESLTMPAAPHQFEPTPVGLIGGDVGSGDALMLPRRRSRW